MDGPRARHWAWLTVMIGLLSPLSAHSEISAELTLRTFDEVWQTVNESYYDAEFGGLDWKGIGDKYRQQAEETSSAEALRPILNDMLGELGESHFGVIPSSKVLEESALIEDSSGEEAAEEATEGSKVLAPEVLTIDDSPTEASEPNESRTREAEEPHAPSGNYSGIHLRMLADKVIVSAVDAESPAAHAGVHAGVIVTKVGKLDVATFIAKAADNAPKSFSRDFFILNVLGELTGVTDDDHQSLTVREPNNRKVQTIRYRPIAYPGKMSHAFANMPSMPLRFEEKQIAIPKGDVLYLAFNIFLPDLMPQLRKAIRKADKDVVGMIIDLRGNPGGVGAMANGLAGVLTDEQFSLGQMTMRAGHINFVAYPQKKAFLGPIAVLVDRMSASTSEIFAAGLQERGRAKVFGRRTMGAALPSFIRELPNGDRLQHAIADYKTPEDRRIEGRGVIPDVSVELRPKRLRRGLDTDVDRALKWLKRQTSKASNE